MYTNPIFTDKKHLFIYALVWFLVSVSYLAMTTFMGKLNIGTALTDIFLLFILFGIGLFLWYPASFLTPAYYSPFKIFTSHILGSTVSTIIWLLKSYVLMLIFLPSTSLYFEYFYNTLIWRFLIGMLFYFLLISFYYLIIYYRTLQENTVKEAELKNSVTEAELKTLKFQINPHFIFNSLNSMSALTSIDPERARSMILKLADFLRYTLANNEKEKTTVGEELKNIRLYLDIEKIRFEDKFEYLEEVTPECQDKLIPNMILQPLFENVIKHAVYESLSKVTLKLKCCVEDSYFQISIENNFEPGYSKSKGTGIGLQNVKRRLELIYGMPDLLDVKREENQFKVTIYIPQ